jgi:hypothetical protein
MPKANKKYTCEGSLEFNERMKQRLLKLLAKTRKLLKKKQKEKLTR